MCFLSIFFLRYPSSLLFPSFLPFLPFSFSCLLPTPKSSYGSRDSFPSPLNIQMRLRTINKKCTVSV